MKSTKTTKSYVKYVRYYIIRRKLLHYQAKIITLSGENYYIIRRKLLYYQAASLLHYQAMLLHYQAVITLTCDYYIIGCNKLVTFYS